MFAFVRLQMDRLFILLVNSCSFFKLLPSLSWYSEPSSYEQLYRWSVMCYFTIDVSLKQIIHRSFICYNLCYVDNATARFLQHNVCMLHIPVETGYCVPIDYSRGSHRLLGLKCLSVEGMMWNLIFLAHIDDEKWKLDPEGIAICEWQITPCYIEWVCM